MNNKDTIQFPGGNRTHDFLVLISLFIIFHLSSKSMHFDERRKIWKVFVSQLIYSWLKELLPCDLHKVSYIQCSNYILKLAQQNGALVNMTFIQNCIVTHAQVPCIYPNVLTYTVITTVFSRAVRSTVKPGSELAYWILPPGYCFYISA